MRISSSPLKNILQFLLLFHFTIPNFTTNFSRTLPTNVSVVMTNGKFQSSELADEKELPIIAGDYSPVIQARSKVKERVADSTRYGLRTENCPNGERPQLTPTGQIKWCKSDEECPILYECVMIIGLTHFGEQIRYCCPSTKSSVCTDDPKVEDDEAESDFSPSQQQQQQQKQQEESTSAFCNAKKVNGRLYFFDQRRLKCLKRPECPAAAAATVVAPMTVLRRAKSGNNFRTLGECRAKCETSACKLGESILLQEDENYDEPVLCDSVGDCPVGYTCREDRLFRRRICCGYKNFEPCAEGFEPFVVPFTGRVRQCSVNLVRDDCPSPYLCTKNEMDQQHYCCTNADGVCSHGQQPYIHPLTDQVIKCNPHNYEVACPAEYMCSAATPGSVWGFCCSQAIVENCPEGTSALINHHTNQPQACSQSDNSCGFTHFCNEVEEGEGICCSRLSRKLPKRPPRLRPKTTAKTTEISPPSSAKGTATDGDEMGAGTVASITEAAIIVDSGGTSVNENSEIDFQAIGNAIDSAIGIVGGIDIDSGNEKNANSILQNRLQKMTPSPISGIESESRQNGGTDLNKAPSSYESPTVRELHEIERKIDALILKKPPPADGAQKSGKTSEKVATADNNSDNNSNSKNNSESETMETVERPQEKKKRRKHKAKKRQKQKSKRTQNTLKCPNKYRPMKYPGTNFLLRCTVDNDATTTVEDSSESDANDEIMDGQTSECPGLSVCIYAVGDRQRRALCCVPKNQSKSSDVTAATATGAESQAYLRMLEHLRQLKTARRRNQAGSFTDSSTSDADSSRSSNSQRKQQQQLLLLAKTVAEEREKLELVESGESPQLSIIKSKDATCPTVIADRSCIPRLMDTCVESGFFCHFNRELKNFMCCSLRRLRKIKVPKF